jgi:2-polyprenyl-6-methoxyphenol hydroxylase-like FAD-dependent oxidoreductase
VAALEPLLTRCVVAGGGPAGMMFGFLLARAGIDVVVLEKHADFFRDFRGDTIHPSTLQLMYELGLLDAFLAGPHNEIRDVAVQIGDDLVTVADMRHLPTHAKFMALMPQWDFLNFLAANGRRYPALHVLMATRFSGLIEAGGTVRGVHAIGPDGPLEIHADLVVGADGRSSDVRAAAGLAVQEIGAPIDVLWMRVSRQTTDPAQVLGRVDYGKFLVMLDRGDYWQCAYVIPKGGFAAVQSAGIEAFRGDLQALVPWLGDRTSELKSWDDVKLLTVSVDRLRAWSRPGVLCIGDAAHAMSPVGGVGINLAVQDAVAAANLLYGPFTRGAPAPGDLRAVQRRREFPMKVIQKMQVVVQNNVIGRVLGSPRKMRAPRLLRILAAIPYLCRLPAYLIGVGPRPEHIGTPERLAAAE